MFNSSILNRLKIKVILAIEKLGFERRKIVKSHLLDKEYFVRNGTIRKKADNDDAWLFNLSKDSKVIFDVGANIGQSAMLMLYHNPEKVVLIDPNPRALSIASENIICNNLSHKCIFYTGFVADKPGKEVDFYTVGSGAAGSKFKTFAKTATKLNSHYKVKTLSLNKISEDCNLIPDLVKIDVEGAEIDVLNGSTNIAAKALTTFFVEIHSGKELSIIDNTKSILNWCEKNNYKAYYLKNKTPLRVEEIKTRGRYHALLLPGNKMIPDCLININEGDNFNQKL